MINNLTDILEKIRNKGIKEIEPYLNIQHGPMIGNMYEGLTKKIMSTAIFKNLGLNVISGKIINIEGKMSKQIDCMIVVGESEKLPYSDDFIAKFEDVIAIIEVKKNFYRSEMEGSYQNLKSVNDIFIPTSDLDLTPVVDSYRGIYGEELPAWEDAANLEITKQMVYHTLLLEASLPLRIVFGFEGYSSEYSFRNAYIEYLNDTTNLKGYGVLNMPNLMICGNSSILKLNGMPFILRNENDNRWIFYGSYPENPMLILLEIIWTRLSYKSKLGPSMFGNDFRYENIRPLIGGSVIKTQEKTGWAYDYFNFTQEELKEFGLIEEWKPNEVGELAFNIFQGLCLELRTNFSDTELIEFICAQKGNLAEIEKEIISTGLVYKNNNGDFGLITKECICVLYKGKFFVGENIDGRMTNYFKIH